MLSGLKSSAVSISPSLHWPSSKPVNSTTFLFGVVLAFLKMAQFGFSSVFFFFVVKSKLYGIIAILVHCFNLCYNTWPGLQNRTWNILSVFIENGGHSYLFTN